MTDASPATGPAPRTTPGAILLRAAPRLLVVVLLVAVAVAGSGWSQVVAAVALLLLALGSAEWVRYVRSGVRPEDAPGRAATIPVRYRGDQDLWLESAGEKKPAVARLVRELTGASHNAAKRVVEEAPVRLRGGFNEDGGAWASAPFEAQGARVSLRPPAG